MSGAAHDCPARKPRPAKRATPPPALSTPAGERGAALIVGLILLSVLSVLGVTGITTSLLDLNMMLNAREGLNAYEVTKSALVSAIGSTVPIAVDETTMPGDQVRAPVVFQLREDGEGNVAAVATTTYVGISPAVPAGWEHGDAVSVHFQVDSETTASLRGAGASQSAGFYIMAPAP